jgi:serine/threonine-protein kinase
MAAHLNSQPVPPIQLDPTLPSALSDIILMAIAKDPSHRFQTADAFRKALESLDGQFRSTGSVTQVVGSGREATAGTTAPLTPAHPLISQAPPAARGQSSRRGLYMAIGSLVTVAVLALAALQGPKWFERTEAATASLPQQTAAPAQPPSTLAEPPAVLPTVEAPASRAENVSLPPASRTQPSAPIAQNTIPAQQMQSQAPPAEPPVQGQEQPAAPATPAVDTARTAALHEARDLLMALGSRANSARATLTRMKEQQARQGLGLRGDITSAEQRMENFLDDAQDAIKSGDLDRAKKSLTNAEREIDRLDGFLGR